MVALITGGAGFIGSHLAEHLLGQGHFVLAVDNLSTGSLENIEHLRLHPRFEYETGDVFDESLVKDWVKRADVIFHLAAVVGVRNIVERPIQTILTNIRCSEVVLETASHYQKPVLITSTSEVYGKSSQVPFSEEGDLVLGPTSKSRWCYAASKIIDEFLAKAYWKDRGLPVVIVRLFNTIGPRQTGRYGMVVPRFVQQALKGEPITVYGDGTQKRAFTWVGDVVRALAQLIQHPRAYGEIFNIGNPKEVSILELARLVKEKTESDSEIVFIPYDQAYEEGFEDMPRRVPDIRKIQQLIGYQPSLSLPEMLDHIIAYFREKLGDTLPQRKQRFSTDEFLAR